MPTPDIERVPENGSDCDSNAENNCNELSDSEPVNVKKTRKRGIIYLSTIPPYMNVAKIREIFSQYGDVGRIYLQSSSKPGEKRRMRKPNLFTEGWVEFEKKSVAKSVTANLNNTKIGTRKRSRYYDMIWNIKYIPRFKWIHLSERLTYERAAMKQRLQAEISQAKKEAHYLQTNVEKSKKLKKKKNLANE
ncbi:pre-rRNA-processing protein esf2-like [Pararge aegeria]|uniref:pre-rRNA-processing protein esf2-like n=1 Tax=Pararge aegeria TaxID=116150 RepID=UPI0019CF687B|nr:pre-rRNA-processing protein esf2-like [Pararge aegeria]